MTVLDFEKLRVQRAVQNTVYNMMSHNWECLSLLDRKWRASQSRHLDHTLEECNGIKQRRQKGQHLQRPCYLKESALSFFPLDTASCSAGPGPRIVGGR